MNFCPFHLNVNEILTSIKGGGGVCRQNICYHVATFRDSISLDMLHDHVLKKLNYDFLTPRAKGGRGGLLSAGKIFATMLLHCVIPFSLICNMTMF